MPFTATATPYYGSIMESDMTPDNLAHMARLRRLWAAQGFTQTAACIQRAIDISNQGETT